MLLNLPPEVLTFHLCRFLDPYALVALSRTCRGLRSWAASSRGLCLKRLSGGATGLSYSCAAADPASVVHVDRAARGTVLMRAAIASLTADDALAGPRPLVADGVVRTPKQPLFPTYAPHLFHNPEARLSLAFKHVSDMTVAGRYDVYDVVGDSGVVASVAVGARSVRNKYGCMIRRQESAFGAFVTATHVIVVCASYGIAAVLPYTAGATAADYDGDEVQYVKLAAASPSAIAVAGRYLALGFANGVVQVIDTDPESPAFFADATTRASWPLFPKGNPVTNLVFSSDGTEVFAACPNVGARRIPLAAFPVLICSALTGRQKAQARAMQTSYPLPRAIAGLIVLPTSVVLYDHAKASLVVFDVETGGVKRRHKVPHAAGLELRSLTFDIDTRRLDLVARTAILSATLVPAHQQPTDESEVLEPGLSDPNPDPEPVAAGPSRKRRRDDADADDDTNGSRPTKARDGSPRALDGVICCLSSVSERKAVLQTAIVEAGGRVTDRVTAGVDLLITDSGAETAKARKANQLGIERLTSVQLRDRIASFDPSQQA
ncbi:uncharacterized protein AMSG_00660 [Thecamonas trahens ATCC 50062]|uniref:BRCT domain-containing protein n=1 Tax=Thecamonas trahens ATCC 50062 TaxID=461836 RepID=A0A0L0DDX5_THETB|nr:hypothetical protein AMSG_00660 [Thecamonas trahens ATCC 50062]KNC50499.1 hypothetical protein AMSG_00660 [Thecamonas trahens ATCC 50062]|eukprot:XP_013762392.1 hypothetical protein AMSG_00660 [Thecamonas trahens ATCC 50062]